jgi:hypothetical protein
VRLIFTAPNMQAAAAILATLGGLLGFILLTVAYMAANDSRLNSGIAWWALLPAASIVGGGVAARSGYLAAALLVTAALCWACLALWAVPGIAVLEVEIAMFELAAAVLATGSMILSNPGARSVRPNLK